jgi:rod shape-determining protein MreC
VNRSRIFALNLLLFGAVFFFHRPLRDTALTVFRLPLSAVRLGVDILLRLPSMPLLARENKALRAELMARQLEVSRLREFARQSTQDAMLRAATPGSSTGIVARVIGRSTLPSQQTILLDRGQRDGLALDTIVLGARGLVGRILELHHRTALVVLLTDTESRIAAMVERSRENGMLFGAGTPLGCQLRYLDDQADVQVGDRIITAGLGEPFPKGLVLGEVTAVARDAVAGTAQVRVKPAAQLGRLEEVLCLLPETQ